MPATPRPEPAPDESAAPGPVLRRRARRWVRRLRRLRPALARRVMRPHIWYVPHPDDETIFMGGSIAAQPHRRNILVVLTHGHASVAKHRVNARLDVPLSTEQFGRARVRELRAAARALGVSRRDLILHDLPDGELHVDDVHDAGHVRRARFHLPVPLAHHRLGSAVHLPERARAAKQAALREYRRWRPGKGRYAVGAHSVPRLIKRQLREPVERVHGPGYEPAEAWHHRVEAAPPGTVTERPTFR